MLQGELADCTFLSACAAIARANSEAIRRLIFDNGDGTYDVTLYVSDGFWSSKSPHVIKVDSRFPSKHGHPAYARQGDAGPRGPELWVMLLEKAFATFQGQYEGGSGIESGHDWTGLEALLPQSSSTYHTMFHTQSHMLEQITQALREKRPIVAGTNPILLPSSRERARSLGISSSHAYSVKSTNPGSATISLQDPRGAVDLDELSMEDFNHFFTDYVIGPAL